MPKNAKSKFDELRPESTRTPMTHEKHGGKANPLSDVVAVWEAKGWKRTPRQKTDHTQGHTPQPATPGNAGASIG